jgi:transcriptional regulator GlxA family with amidase domain
VDPKLWAPDPEGWKVGILWLPNASVSSLYGAYEDLVAANHVAQTQPAFGSRGFRPWIVSASGRPERGLVGPRVTPDAAAGDAPPFDALIVPALMDEGSLSAPAPGVPCYPEALKALLRDHYEQGGLIAGLCTGSSLLAEAGLLDGERASTHWLYRDAFEARFPRVEVVSNPRLLRTGRGGRILMGGSSAYMTDVVLPVIATFAGVELTRELARLFGKFWRDDPRDGRVEGMDRPPELDSTIAAATAWLRAHALAGGTVAGAAEHVHLTERTFTRRFRRALGMTPNDFLRGVKVERARELLERSRIPTDEVAARVGYADPAAFRRAFRRETGMTPAAYRRQFKLPAAAPSLQPADPS